jgi:hypothetical protein
MTTGTTKPLIQIGWGIIFICVVSLLCWAVGSALV